MFLIRSLLIHGYILDVLLLSIFMPIIKDKLGLVNKSTNYRSVFPTSIIFKTELGFHKLQFAYQPGVSSFLCSWAVLETINYYRKSGSEVFICSMDKTKAFDLCKFSILFKKIHTKVNPVFTRLLIYMHCNQ